MDGWLWDGCWMDADSCIKTKCYILQCKQSINSRILGFFVFYYCFTDAGNQLVAQEAVRKPSMLRRPSARAGESVSTKNGNKRTILFLL